MVGFLRHHSWRILKRTKESIQRKQILLSTVTSKPSLICLWAKAIRWRTLSLFYWRDGPEGFSFRRFPLAYTPFKPLALCFHHRSSPCSSRSVCNEASQSLLSSIALRFFAIFQSRGSVLWITLLQDAQDGDVIITSSPDRTCCDGTSCFQPISNRNHEYRETSWPRCEHLRSCYWRSSQLTLLTA